MSFFFSGSRTETPMSTQRHSNTYGSGSSIGLSTVSSRPKARQRICNMSTRKPHLYDYLLVTFYCIHQLQFTLYNIG